MAKLFATVIEKRLTAYQFMTKAVPPEQFGFTKHRRTLDAVFILDTLIDQAYAKNEMLYVGFIDFNKAYDYVFREGLMYKMIHGGMIGPILKVIHSMYESVMSVVRCGFDVSDVIHQFVGVRQGCVLSPCLFTLFIADLPQFLRDKGCKGIMIKDKCINSLWYADDGAFLAASAADLQCMFDALREYASLWRMFMNSIKTIRF